MMKYFSLATFSLSLAFNIFTMRWLGVALFALYLSNLCIFLAYRLMHFIKLSNFMASNSSTPFFFFPCNFHPLLLFSLYKNWCAWWCGICFWGSINVSLFFAFSLFLFFRDYRLILKFSDVFFWKSKLLFSVSGKFWFQELNFYSLEF